MSQRKSVIDDAGAHDRGFHAAFVAVRAARKKHVKVRPHRAITPLNVTPWLLAQVVVLPIILCALLWWARPLLVEFWRQCILFWSPGLELFFGLSPRADQAGTYTLVMIGSGAAARMPGPVLMLVTTLFTLLGLLLSGLLKGAVLPLKYPLRIACVIQLVTLVYFWLTPNDFPYSVARHSEELMTIGFVVMLSTPVMLAVGYYILNQSLLVKLFHTVLILLFFAVMIPHQVLMQALIMEHLSVLFMPLLYICFGAVFDALVFVALYSWAVSNAPADATV